jgi:hypothetical protein
MHERVADVLIKLAEGGAADGVLDGLNDNEKAAILSGDDEKVFALFARERAPAPAVAKIWTGVDESPAETPAVAKIWTGVEDGETPAVAKIWTGVDEHETPAVAKIWTGVDEEETPAVAKIWTGVDEEIDVPLRKSA